MKKITLPRNFCSSSDIEGTRFSPIKKSTTLDEPPEREKDLHLEGLSFIPIESMLLLISLISFWWVLLFVVIRQKSSAYGNVINLLVFSSSTIFFRQRLYPKLFFRFRYWIIGLNVSKKIIGEYGSPC